MKNKFKVSNPVYGGTCDGWNAPCDLSTSLKCLSQTEGSGCLGVFSGKKCDCSSVQYYSGSTCGKVLRKI